MKLIDKDSKRSYAASVYYAPNSDRSNLIVLTNAHVDKVLFKEQEGDSVMIASAVSFAVNEKKYIVKAVNEIIVSAGAFHNAQILELSGIGSRSLLEEQGIKVSWTTQMLGRMFE